MAAKKEPKQKDDDAKYEKGMNSKEKSDFKKKDDKNDKKLAKEVKSEKGKSEKDRPKGKK